MKSFFVFGMMFGLLTFSATAQIVTDKSDWKDGVAEKVEFKACGFWIAR
jgi:hypothetical protein